MYIFKNKKMVTGDMALQLRTLLTLADHPDLMPTPLWWLAAISNSSSKKCSAPSGQRKHCTHTL